MSFLHPVGPVIELGINIDHVATLRNARGTAYPDPIRAALEAEEAGADVITLHLREDRRHIRDADVEAIRPLLRTRMNLEAAVTSEMIDFSCRIKPQDSCWCQKSGMKSRPKAVSTWLPILPRCKPQCGNCRPKAFA